MTTMARFAVALLIALQLLCSYLSCALKCPSCTIFTNYDKINLNCGANEYEVCESNYCMTSIKPKANNIEVHKFCGQKSIDKPSEGGNDDSQRQHSCKLIDRGRSDDDSVDSMTLLCQCNRKDFCNRDMQWQGVETIPTIQPISISDDAKMIMCEQSSGGSSTRCHGNYCSYEIFQNAEIVGKKGCLNDSQFILPVPPLHPISHIENSICVEDDNNNRIFCYCNTELCNQSPKTAETEGSLENGLTSQVHEIVKRDTTNNSSNFFNALVDQAKNVVNDIKNANLTTAAEQKMAVLAESAKNMTQSVINDIKSANLSSLEASAYQKWDFYGDSIKNLTNTAMAKMDNSSAVQAIKQGADEALKAIETAKNYVANKTEALVSDIKTEVKTLMTPSNDTKANVSAVTLSSDTRLNASTVVPSSTTRAAVANATVAPAAAATLAATTVKAGAASAKLGAGCVVVLSAVASATALCMSLARGF